MIPKPVELELYRFLQRIGANDKHLLAVSGGADSMALLLAYQRVAHKVGVPFAVAVIHHGPSSEPEMVSFRERSCAFVKEFCRRHQVEFHTNDEVAEQELQSEADFRDFRYLQLRKIMEQSQAQFLVLAHHQGDLFETRLIQLLRGCGGKGLSSLQEISNDLLRPFLGLSRQQLEGYLTQLEVKWLEDPSNQDDAYMRNWLRRQWLPSLEAFRPGAVMALSRSLENLATEVESSPTFSHCFDEGRVLRSELLHLTPSEASRVLALYMKRCGLQDYGRSHIEEVLKRLDVKQNELTFRLLKRNWFVNASHIWCD